MNRVLWVLGCCLLLANPVSGNTPPRVTNVVAVQRANTSIVDLTYDIADDDDDHVAVTLMYSVGSENFWGHKCITVAGDVGEAVFATTGLHATWDVGVDFPAFKDTEFSIRVHADDGLENVPIGFVLIPPRAVQLPVTFTMGSSLETGQMPHEVTLNRHFIMSSCEVTNAQFVTALQWAFDNKYALVQGGDVVDNLDGSSSILLDLNSRNCQITFNDSVFSTVNPERPVVEVSWFGSAAYCDWLSLINGLPRAYDHATWSCNNNNPYGSTSYRLPTEAEWEFACRAGTTTPFNTGDCLDANTQANYNGSHPYADCDAGQYLAHTTNVGSYPANSWGLKDMHGNVLEWCDDWYGRYLGPETEPQGPAAGNLRVLRSSRWFSQALGSFSSSRKFGLPDISNSGIGFRPVKSLRP